MAKELYDDLYNRRKTVREVAKELGVSENYLSHAIPERAPKRNPKLLKVTRRMYQDQIARETIEGKHTVTQGAELAYVSERTFFRRLAALRANSAKTAEKQG
jgi:AraC-like DNA-binding protein